MDEVCTCLCGSQNCWQIGEGRLKCTVCDSTYYFPMSSFYFNVQRNKLCGGMSDKLKEMLKAKEDKDE